VEKMVGGVCGGIAEYLDIDVTLVRIICLLAIFSGIGLIPYIIAWILIPENPYQLKGKIVEEEPKAEEHQQDSTVEAEDNADYNWFRDFIKKNIGSMCSLISFSYVFVTVNKKLVTISYILFLSLIYIRI
jgi:phage shock protein PspC (stress-responsive transcriptional regulator)